MEGYEYCDLDNNQLEVAVKAHARTASVIVQDGSIRQAKRSS